MNKIRFSSRTAQHRPRTRQGRVQVGAVARVARRFTFRNAAQFPPEDNEVNFPGIAFVIKHVGIVRGLDLGYCRGDLRRAVVCSSSSSWHSAFGVMLLTRSWALGKGPVRSV